MLYRRRLVRIIDGEMMVRKAAIAIRRAAMLLSTEVVVGREVVCN